MEAQYEPVEIGSPEDVARYLMRGLMGMSRALISAEIEGRDPLPGMNPDTIVMEILRRIEKGDPDELRVLRNRLDTIARVEKVISFAWARRLGIIKKALREMESPRSTDTL